MVAVQRWKLKIKTVKSMVFYFKKVKRKQPMTMVKNKFKTNLKQIDQMLNAQLDCGRIGFIFVRGGQISKMAKKSKPPVAINQRASILLREAHRWPRRCSAVAESTLICIVGAGRFWAPCKEENPLVHGNQH